MTKSFAQITDTDKNTLMVVDSLNLAFRYKHSGAVDFVTDYMRTVESLKKSYKTTKLIIAGDMGSSSYRKVIYPEYKQNRKDKYADQTEAEKAAIAAAKKAQNSLRAYQFVGDAPFSPKDKNVPVPPIKVTKEMKTFAEATKAVIVNLEGGYWDGGAISDPRYKDSKETMLGIDRGHKNSTATEKKFWALVDANKKTWSYNHIPPDPLKTQLIDAVIAIMKPDYEKLRNTYLDKEVIALILSDGRLFYNMVYAVWNGPAYFKGYSNILNNSYKHGYKTSEQLLDVFLKERIAGGGTAYSFGTGKNLGPSAKSLNNQGGLKIKKAVGL